MLPATNLALALPVVLNHGPGTSGGGLSTSSGELLRAGGWDVSVRYDRTQFEHVSRAEAEARAIASDEFDALRSSSVATVSIAYGISDGFQLAASTGYYAGDDFIDAEADGVGGAESAVADPSGLTDLWIDGKLRIAHGPAGRWALLAGIKLPTGDDEETLSNGERLEPSSQPGTGAFDGRVGLAFSRYLDPRWTVDASGSYTLRGVHDGFRVGDRADLGVALAWRATADVQAFPNHSVSAELSGVWLGKDEEGSVENPNSGGTSLFGGLGWRTRFDAHTALAVGGSLPIAEDPNGDQVESEWKLSVGFTWSM